MGNTGGNQGDSYKVSRKAALATGAGLLGAAAELSVRAPSAAARGLQEAAAVPTVRAPNGRILNVLMGAQGTPMKGGVFAFSLGREDLNVSVQRVRILPDFGLAFEANFVGIGNGVVMVAGEIPVRETEVNATLSRLENAGIQVSALHNHRIEMNPHVMWIHFAAQGPQATIASGVRRSLPATAKLSTGGSSPKSTPLPVKRLSSYLGGDAKIDDGGVVEVSVERLDPVRINGIVVPSAMGVESMVYFQPLAGGMAAVTGELALTADEVNPVARRLRQSNVQVTAIHNHYLTDQPRLFYMHTWATGNPINLALAHRAALDTTRSKRGAAGAGRG